MYGTGQFLDSFDGYDGAGFEAAEEAAWLEGEAEAGWGFDALDGDRFDANPFDIAETLVARESEWLGEQPARSWTRCFSKADVGRVVKLYVDNAAAARAQKVDRCSCIVMLNVALGQLLSLPLRPNRARGKSNRIVQMGKLTTETIEKAMAQLVRSGYALAPAVINFLDAHNHVAGTLKPERLRSSPRQKLLDLTSGGKCWFAFGLSIMDGFHSVLLLVDRTGAKPGIYWLDQFSFSPGAIRDVTTALDDRLLQTTRTYWQGVLDQRGKCYSTMIRLWPLRQKK